MKQIFTLFLICVASLTFAQFNDGLTPKGPKMNQGFSVKGNSVTNIEKKTMTNSQTAIPSSYAVNQAISYAVNQAISDSRPYKVYTALLTSQTFLNPPIFSILENTIGSIVWTRVATGSYLATLAGAFKADKTYLSITYPTDSGSHEGVQFRIGYGSVNTILLQTSFTNAPNAGLPYEIGQMLIDFPISIEIRVYN